MAIKTKLYPKVWEATVVVCICRIKRLVMDGVTPRHMSLFKSNVIVTITIVYSWVASSNIFHLVKLNKNNIIDQPNVTFFRCDYQSWLIGAIQENWRNLNKMVFKKYTSHPLYRTQDMEQLITSRGCQENTDFQREFRVKSTKFQELLSWNESIIQNILKILIKEYVSRKSGFQTIYFPIWTLTLYILS